MRPSRPELAVGDEEGQPSCEVCGWSTRRDNGEMVCPGCLRVTRLIRSFDDLLFLIVDGSFRGGRPKSASSAFGGAGLVLVAGSLTGEVVAQRACRFRSSNSTESEREAIVRGQKWAPNVATYSDCEDAIIRARQTRANVFWLSPLLRKHHQLAHELANAGRVDLYRSDVRQQRTRVRFARSAARTTSWSKEPAPRRR
jgi:hypothetical protein